MELRHIRYFVAVAEELHFTRAAAKLQTAQPALSQQIRRLERELGVSLFHRATRHVELTHTGRALLPYARSVVDATGRLKRAANHAVDGNLGRLTIGFKAQPTLGLLPDLLASYRQRHPDVDLKLLELGNREQENALTNGRIDIALMTRSSTDPRVRVIRLQRIRLAVVMPTDHRLANQQSVRLRDLADEPWISPAEPEGSLHTACIEAGFEPRVAQQASEHAARLAFAAAGLGLTLDVDLPNRPPHERVVHRPITHPPVTVDLLAAWRHDRPSPVVDGLVEVARSIATDE